MENSAETNVIDLHFSKAFDIVHHKLFICNLRQYGIKGKVLLWIESFLAIRRQRVALRKCDSSWENATRLNSRIITNFLCK